MTIIGTIIFGAVIGILARLFLPGRQQIGMIMTVLIGIVGALIGYWLAGLFGVASTAGIDWIRWIFSIVVAAILVVGYERIMGRSKV
ncbi:MAG: GlsB/YeaQ/YmgE family stress response membrane protein [Oryzihumus sp.]